MPLFSVLMSVYYKENPMFLSDCLDSILIHQTLLPTEVILVKDGKLTPELEVVIQKYKQKFNCLKIIDIIGGKGLYHALNVGLAECQYEWIARMDTDDIAVPTRFEQQFNYLKTYHDVDVLGSNITEFDETIQQINYFKQMPENHHEIVKMSRFRNPVNHMTVIYKKSAVLKVGGYQVAPYMEDYYLWVRMIAKGFRFANMAAPLVYARIGNGMHKRRGHLSQIKGKIIINNFMLKNGMISIVRYIMGLFITIGFTILPNCIRKIIYIKILRKTKRELS